MTGTSAFKIGLNPGNLSSPSILGTCGALMEIPAMLVGIVMYVGSSLMRHVSSSNTAGTTMRV